MNKSVYAVNGNKVFLQEESHPEKKLPNGIYVLKMAMGVGFYLELTNEFELPKVVYGNTEKEAKRFIKTWALKASNTGALLIGEKGSGKTLLAKQISHMCLANNIPTIIINTAFTGVEFNTFLDSIDQPCVVIFDEFEKIYSLHDQQSILTLLDGTSVSNKLFLLTANNPGNVHNAFIGRPGRVHYRIEYYGITKEFYDEYVNKNLKNKKFLIDFDNLYYVSKKMNFDTMEKLVWESNEYNESPKEFVSLVNFEAQPKLRFKSRISSALMSGSDYKIIKALTGGHLYEPPTANEFSATFTINCDLSGEIVNNSDFKVDVSHYKKTTKSSSYVYSRDYYMNLGEAKEISSLRVDTTAGLNNSNLIITTNDGKTHSFVLDFEKSGEKPKAFVFGQEEEDYDEDF